jgi:hypothetical protein
MDLTSPTWCARRENRTCEYSSLLECCDLISFLSKREVTDLRKKITLLMAHQEIVMNRTRLGLQGESQALDRSNERSR